MENSHVDVLLIEDSPACVSMLRNYLGQVGCTNVALDHVENLTAGLARLAERAYDAILLDLGLPESAGLETLRTLRSHAPSIPTIVLTVLDEDRVAVDAVKLGADDYLNKNRLDAHLFIRALFYAIERGRRRAAQDARADLQRATDVVRQREQWARALLNATTESILLTDTVGNVLAANTTVAERLHTTTAAMLGKCVFDLLRPEVAAGRRAAFDRVVESGEALRFEDEHSGMILDNNFYPVHDSDGAVTGVAIFARDMTVQKQAEEALRRSNDELEERVRARTEELHAEIHQRAAAEDALRDERKTLQHLLRSSDHERQLIAYEIHDELAQQLAGAIMQFDAFVHLRDTKPAAAQICFEAGLALLRSGHAESRRLINGVRPPILDEAGIVEAVDHLINDQASEGVPTIEFEHDTHFERLDSVLENVIYRVVQEGLTNAIKHSGSRRIRIELLEFEASLRVEIRDWGKGFPPDLIAEGCFGLEGIRERARLLGGTALVESWPGQGTRIVAELPLIQKERHV